jgi:hypothetical protein
MKTHFHRKKPETGNSKSSKQLQQEKMTKAAKPSS